MFTRTLMAALALAIAVTPLAAAQDDTADDAAPVKLKEGDMAPDFTLEASDGNTYTLSDFRGKKPVVLAFFPKAFTPGCTAQCKSYGEAAEQIDTDKVQYFMISVDSVEQQKRFAEEYGQNQFPILADPDKKVSEAYGVLMPVGVPNRWTFYIDREGRITKIDKKVRAVKAAEDMLAILGDMGVDAQK